MPGCGGASSWFIPANYIAGASGVGSDDIPNSATGADGVVQSFQLWEVDEDGVGSYVSKGLGSWTYTQYNPGWSSLADFGQSEVDLGGGTGSNARVLMRVEAWPGPGGAPVYSRYKISSFVDGGQDYTVGDVLNLTGFTATAQLRKTYGSSNAAATFTCSHNGVGGTVTMTLTDTVTTALEAGRYVYDLLITDGSGSISRVVEGQATVTPGVTR